MEGLTFREVTLLVNLRMERRANTADSHLDSNKQINLLPG